MPDTNQAVKDARNALFATRGKVMGDDVGHIRTWVEVNAPIAQAITLHTVCSVTSQFRLFKLRHGDPL